MGLLRLLLHDPFTFALLALPLLYSIILHELAHGWVALRMGDPTAKLQGRLTLNPLRHLDPVGTLMLFVFGFGWAKPVPVTVHNLRPFRRGFILVSAAGIAANTAVAFLALFLQRWLAPGGGGVATAFLYMLAHVNLMLAAFNLIPIPPLDGSKILIGLSSGPLQYFLLRLERYGFFIVLAMLAFGLLDPLIRFFRSLLLALIGLLLP
ncbi:MAG: site-2 protease family protein [Desulfobacterales bacterium]